MLYGRPLVSCEAERGAHHHHIFPGYGCAGLDVDVRAELDGKGCRKQALSFMGAWECRSGHGKGTRSARRSHEVVVKSSTVKRWATTLSVLAPTRAPGKQVLQDTVERGACSACLKTALACLSLWAEAFSRHAQRPSLDACGLQAIRRGGQTS